MEIKVTQSRDPDCGSKDQMALSKFTKSTLKYISKYKPSDISSNDQDLQQNPNLLTN
jgi:hypothetical protein